MVLDKSIETLEDLVRFLNRKQSFYFKLYDRYLEGDHSRLDDSRKHEADCNAVCDDIVECIKAISDEAQIRGVAKKPKVLCTLDGQDEERCILDEWLLKVVRLLDNEANWNRMLAPVEGKDMNNAFDAILFRLTWIANFLDEISAKTEDEYYGGRRTDVTPYYIGESHSKNLRDSKRMNEAETKYMACCYDPEDYYEETNYIDENGELNCNSSGAKLFDTEDEAIEYADEIKPIGWMSFAMPFNTTLNESDDNYKAKRLKESYYVAIIYNYDDNYDEYYIDENGKPVNYLDKAKVFDNLQDAEKWAEEHRYYNFGSYASKLSESKKRLKELTQDEFNRLARRRDEFRSQTAISPAEKNNLYADIKDFEEEFRDLQDTAERLPDSYIDQVCSTSSYPFDVAIDEVQNVEDWCSEAEEFLKDDINNWGIMKEASLSKKRFKETFDSTSAAFNLTKLKGYLRFETNWEYDEDFLEDAMLVDKVHEPPRFTVKWIGPEGKKHPNTYCVRIRRDTGESWNWETHYCLKASDAAEMINLEVGTWEHNNISWKFESKEQLPNSLPESIDDFPKNTHQMYRFAKQKHDATGAIRKHSGDPYWVHPEGVAKIAAAYGGTDIEIQAAMAHDTLEDTNCSYEELEEMFGDEVASIVREITNDTEEVDRLGKEQYINLELINLSHPALFVKLCDMYYNQMDFPTEAQKRRMIKNINYLLANREDDLNENEIALIEDILQTLLY